MTIRILAANAQPIPPTNQCHIACRCKSFARLVEYTVIFPSTKISAKFVRNGVRNGYCASGGYRNTAHGCVAGISEGNRVIAIVILADEACIAKVVKIAIKNIFFIYPLTDFLIGWVINGNDTCIVFSVTVAGFRHIRIPVRIGEGFSAGPFPGAFGDLIRCTDPIKSTASAF